MIRLSGLMLLVALAAAFVGCNPSSHATELTLTISSDLRVPDELDRVTVSVVGQDVAQDPSANLADQPLPRSLTLVHESGPYGPLNITVRGWHGDELVVQKDFQSWFVPSVSKTLQVELERACRDILCSAGNTCEDGACVPVPVIDGPDAGIVDQDAGPITPSRDASTDAKISLDGSAVRDASAVDASSTDASLTDAAPADGGLADGGPTDASTPDGGGTIDHDAGPVSPPDAGPPPPNPGLPPTCAIALPTAGDSYQINTAVALSGSCNDPETGPLAQGISWSSSLDGALGTSAALNVMLAHAGAQRLSLCAADPIDASVIGCATVDITLSVTAQPTVGISAITQAGASTQPFSAALPIVFTGTATGAGVSLSWSDDLQGPLGTGSSVTLDNALVGRHTVTLTAKDRAGLSKSATRAYVVVAAGETNLVSPYTPVNVTLDMAGDPGVTMIASDPQSRAYVPNSSGVLYRFDGNSLTSPAAIAIGQPPLVGLVQDAQLVADKNLSYLATTQGLTVCSFNAPTGVLEPCTTYGAGLALQSINVLSVLRMATGPMMTELLLEGTASGVFLPDSVTGSTRGSVLLRGRRINDMVAVSGQAALATDNGLYMLNPTSQATVRSSTTDGLLSNQLSSLALGSDGSLWIGTSSGLNRYQPSAATGSRWSSWTSDTGLAGNRVNGVALQHVTALSPARDVIWIASSGGVTRLDTLTNTLQRFTTADGLPSNEVLAVNVLANGIKLFGTSKGLGHFVGP